ncbi:MAG: alkaline phosphatase family protein [Acidobacteriota bacterium]|nr:alkaline phosphatase family protein [Blastocatellia bacterium]MDW8413744.1 alkaline phosphatase family protein [Acidobacteriota bacterium]
MNPQVVVVGLDAATMLLIEQYVAEGRLPNIAKMMSNGGKGLLLSTPNVHSASAWTSIITGKNPGKHGLYVFSERDFATNEQVIYTGRDRKCESIFAMLAHAGKTAGMINVPMTYPAESAQGSFMISGLDAPLFDENAFSPVELRTEVMKRFPGYAPTPPKLPEVMAKGRLDEAIELWTELAVLRTEAAKYLMELYRPDFFMVVYTCTDWAQHYFWKYIEPRHPEYDEREARRYGGTIRYFYELMDEQIGELRAVAGEDANFIIVSDHGMGCHTQGSFHMVEYLQSCGLLTLKESRVPSADVGTLGALKQGVRRTLSAVLPGGVKRAIKGMVGEVNIPIAQKNSFYERIVWEKTIAYTEYGRNIVNINLKGRNKYGIVEPKDYEKVCDEVTNLLLQWKEVETGRPIVSEVRKRSQVYTGQYVSHASDLYVVWNPDVILKRPVPEAIRRKGFWWNGAHRPHGVIICDGPKIRPGSTVQNAVVYDIVPTVLLLLAIVPPSDLDGRVLQELLKEEALEQLAVSIQSSYENTAGRYSFSELEEREVAEKLRGLGYL